MSAQIINFPAVHSDPTDVGLWEARVDHYGIDPAPEIARMLIDEAPDHSHPLVAYLRNSIARGSHT
jgi:hypothetical protein